MHAVIAMAIAIKAVCQSQRKMSQVTRGEKRNGPKPLPDIVSPMTRPRREANQRVISVAVEMKKTLRPREAMNPYQK